MKKDKTVIVSDLHIDTWNERNNLFGRRKIDHFHDFLDWIAPFTKNFVINGDLLDAPPPKRSNILPAYEAIFSRLAAFAADRNVYYFIGNHDIGFWGLRVRDFNNINCLYAYYPHLHVRPDEVNPNTYIYFEHGHFYDPVLNLYIRNMVKTITPKAGLSQVKDVVKRLINIYFRPGRRPEPGNLRGIDAGTINHTALRAAQRRDPKTGEQVQPIGTSDWRNSWHALETFLWKKIGPLIGEYYTPLNWQDAAFSVFKDFCTEHPEKEVRALIFGHTHLPDEKELQYGDKRAIYLNSGDWSEPVLDKDLPTHHSSFIILDRNGEPVRDTAGKAVRDFIVENYEAAGDPAAESTAEIPST